MQSGDHCWKVAVMFNSLREEWEHSEKGYFLEESSEKGFSFDISNCLY